MRASRIRQRRRRASPLRSDLKPFRVTLRIGERDAILLRREARRRDAPIGEIIRDLIRSHLGKSRETAG